MSNRVRIKPTPGLQGDLRGTCIACMTPTDTALGVAGDGEWHIAFLLRLGLPKDEAAASVQALEPSIEPGSALIWSDRREELYRVCADCATKVGPARPVLAIRGARIPAYRQPEVTE